MLITKKMLIGLGLVVALVGAGAGSLLTHTAQNTEAANTAANSNYESAQTANPTANTPEQLEATKSAQFSTTAEQTAYRQGFDEGFSSCQSAQTNVGSGSYASYNTSTRYNAPVRRAYSSGSRRVYYDYSNRPRGRTFWQKHRDKLTMAIGTGAGAAFGGLIGGKKGAGIGSLVGLGGSALYTYKLRHRTRRY